MFSFFKDFRWDKLKFDVTRLLGRLYYFNFALFWWIVDIIVFVVCGVSITTLIVAIPLGYFTITTTIKWLGTLIYATLCKSTKNKLEDMLDRANALEGVPGAGKTSSINQMGLLLAKKQWQKLKFEYWQICHLKYEFLPKKLQDKYYEVIKAYNYYKKYEADFIPCLHSFISIKDKQGRCSYSFTKNHFLQHIAVPYRSVWICDEISAMFPNNTKGEDKEVEEMARWIRHFTDSYGLFADIRFNATFLGIRSACGCRLNLYKKQKWVLKPKFLIGVIKFLESFIDFYFWLQQYTKVGSKTHNGATRSLKSSAKHLSPFLKWLNKLKNSVGYREYYYEKSGSREQSGSEQALKKGKYWFTSCLDIYYDERAFRNLYKCKDMDFEQPVKRDILMSTEEIKKTLNR